MPVLEIVHNIFFINNLELYSEIVLTSENVRDRTHVHINFLLRITDTMTSQNIDRSSWDTLYKRKLKEMLVRHLAILRSTKSYLNNSCKILLRYMLSYIILRP
jgi:hypothetical protein